LPRLDQPSGGSLSAILGPCIEGNHRAWGSLMNSVDDSFEYCEAPGRQADARSDYNTIVARRSQLTRDCRPGGFIRSDEANVGLPSTRNELLERDCNAGANLLSSHTWRQRGIGEIHSLWVVADL
jgi:hypothetical protein